MEAEKLHPSHFTSKQNCMLNKTTDQQDCIFYLLGFSSEHKEQRKFRTNLRVVNHYAL